MKKVNHTYFSVFFFLWVFTDFSMKYQWCTYERSWHKKFIKETNEVHRKFILEEESDGEVEKYDKISGAMQQ